MLWPLLFTRFLLAFTARTSDDATTASTTPVVGPSPALKEVLCRMLGNPAGQSDAECAGWAAEGCGCPIDKPREAVPKLSPNTMHVGWETVDNNNKAGTAITFSFEKEWEGDAPDLHKWFEPGGRTCEELWPSLQDTEKQRFMAEFRAVRNPYQHDSLVKYQQFVGDEPCALKVSSKHLLLPLKRTERGGGDEAPASIYPYLEFDHGPWEMKANTFFFDLSEMSEVVKSALDKVNVPGYFPAERRIQVHVVAPLKPDFYKDHKLKRSFRLVQLFFSDYMLLHLFLPNGPNGEQCSGFGGEFNCDVFSDQHNSPIMTEDANKATNAQQDDPVDDSGYRKFEIVGLRGSDEETYEGTKEEKESQKALHRIGFEIRKSSSFDHAVRTASAIARAIGTMKTDGTASVGVKDGRAIDIAKVLQFAEEHRTKYRGCELPVNLFDEHTNPYKLTVSTLAMYLYMTVAGRQITWRTSNPPPKLLAMLRVLLCSDWTKLLKPAPAGAGPAGWPRATGGRPGPKAIDGDVVSAARLATTSSRAEIMQAFEELQHQVEAAFRHKHQDFDPMANSYQALQNKVLDDFQDEQDSFPKNVFEHMHSFHMMVAQYAYQLSEHF